jgi:FkbM family methyltransferase
MRSLIARGVDIYNEEGAAPLLKKTLQKIHRQTYYKINTIRGQYSLTLSNQTVKFSAPTRAMVKRNQSRFKSENRVLENFINEISEDDVVYDIGANTGLYTIFGAKACPNGRVISFEPYPPNLDILKKDIARNNLLNVNVLEIALSDSVGSIKFSQPDVDDIGYGSSSIETRESKSTIEVPTTTGDHLISEGKIPSPNVVKIDVEGSEPLVLKGLEKSLSDSRCRTLFCEVHLSSSDHRPCIEDFGSSLEDIQNQIRQYGFTVEQLDSRGDEILLRAQK